jgi:transcription elongation factor GreA-like protein
MANRLLPASIQEWNKKKDPEVSYVQDRQKDDLWNSLMTNFSLPPEEDPNKLVILQKVKAFALKKMAELFKNWKKLLNTKFVDKEKTPEFIGQYEKIKDQWPAFVAYKKSDKAKQRS